MTSLSPTTPLVQTRTTGPGGCITVTKRWEVRYDTAYFTLTLARIQAKGPCPIGWVKLLTSRGFTRGNLDPEHRVSLGDIVASSGAEFALWCVRCYDWADVEVRRVVVAALLPVVKRASFRTRGTHLCGCITVIERWAAGDDTADLTWVRAEVETVMGAVDATCAARVARRDGGAWAAGTAGVTWSAAVAVRAAATAAAGEMWALDVVVVAAGRAARSVGEAWVDELAAQRADLIDAFGRTTT